MVVWILPLSENAGKSGGIRACYVDFVFIETVYLITIYPKSEKDNLSQAERNSIKKMISALEQSLKQKQLKEEQNMTSVYESIMAGLSEALEDAEGKTELKRRTVTLVPFKTYNVEQVKNIRNGTGLSQKVFASYMGVSTKTVEAWEAETNTPSGAASRILTMMEMDDHLTEQFPFVIHLI